MKVNLLFFFLLILLSLDFTPSVAQSAKIGIPEVEFYDRMQYGAGSQNWKMTQNNYGLLFFC